MTREEQKQIADFVRSHIHEIITESGTDKNAHTNWVLRFVADGIETMDTEPCEDAISRAAAIKAMDDLEQEDIELYGCSIPEGFDGKRAIEALQKLPSVTPKQKMGHWILDHVVCDVIYEYHCSACGHHLELGGRTIKQDQAEGYSLFCNGCGAKMQEVDE